MSIPPDGNTGYIIECDLIYPIIIIIIILVYLRLSNATDNIRYKK